jgi:hypothetical protein
MKLTEISILTVKRKDRLPLLLILGAMLWGRSSPGRVSERARLARYTIDIRRPP